MVLSFIISPLLCKFILFVVCFLFTNLFSTRFSDVEISFVFSCLVLLIFCVEQIGSTLFKLAVVTTQQADEMVAEKSGNIEEARTAYERAEDMLRQANRY